MQSKYQLPQTKMNAVSHGTLHWPNCGTEKLAVIERQIHQVDETFDQKNVCCIVDKTPYCSNRRQLPVHDMHGDHST